MTLGVGIVGCGMIARIHAMALAEMAGAKLVACCSRRSDAAQEFAKNNSCRAYESVDDMLHDPQLQVVSICTPSGAHLEPALVAAKAGKHVIIEKPLEVTLQRCNQIIDVCEQQNVKLATVFPSRFHECWRKVKEAVDAGRFGRLSLGNAYVKWFRTQEYYDSGKWRGTWELDGGGALMNQAIHTIDLLQWIMGRVDSVSAAIETLAHVRIEVEDTAAVCLKFRNGALGTIEATTASFPGMFKKIEIHGDEGSAVIEEENIRHWKFLKEELSDASVLKTFGGQASSGGGASDPSAIAHWGHKKMFEDFIQAIEYDRAPFICGREGRKSVEIILAIYEAARTKRWVGLSAS